MRHPRAAEAMLELGEELRGAREDAAESAPGDG